ncbi:hypothetical protein [Treponema sp.]|uniref:hypothetical protein n=1 Tax=Treponema sp. TaxID=166 RepID=UPI003F034ABF
MKQLSQKKALLIFYGFDLILLLALLVFIPLTKKNSPEVSRLKFIDSAKEISSVEIFNAVDKSLIVIAKKGRAWIGTDDASNMTINWPCDTQTMERLLSEAEKEHTLFKKADRVSSWEKLGVDEKNSCRLTFFKGNHEKECDLFFGAEDSITERISLRTANDQTVWETKTGLSAFVFKDSSFWADPYIAPVCASGAESSSSLRRGPLVYLSPSSSIKPEKVITRIFPNETKAVYSIYSRENSYIVIPLFFPQGEDAEAVKSINYRYSISQWTYNKFLEESNE